MPVDATAAARLGFVQEVVPRDALDDTAMALAREIAANAPLAVQGIKRTINMFAERGMSEAYRAGVIAQTPLARFGTPEDVAAAAVFLCSDEASFITGSAYDIDGGATLLR